MPPQDQPREPFHAAARVRLSRPAIALIAALAIVGSSGSSAPVLAAADAPACDRVPGNLLPDCGFARGVGAWRAQAASTVEWERRLGRKGPGALAVVNEPASEAGAVTCVALAGGGGDHEITGFARRLDGPGECLAVISEHTTPDCSGGAARFHELPATPVAASSFTPVGGRARLAGDTLSVTVGFACYGEHDDDVGRVLIDDVALVRLGS